MTDFAHVLCGCSSRFSTFAFSLTDDEMGSGYRGLRGHCERPDDSDPLAFKMVPQVLPLDLRAPTLRGPRPIHCLHDFRLARAAPRWRVRHRPYYPQLYRGYISYNLPFVICLLTPLGESSLTLLWWVAFICLDL